MKTPGPKVALGSPCQMSSLLSIATTIKCWSVFILATIWSNGLSFILTKMTSCIFCFVSRFDQCIAVPLICSHMRSSEAHLGRQLRTVACQVCRKSCPNSAGAVLHHQVAIHLSSNHRPLVASDHTNYGHNCHLVIIPDGVGHFISHCYLR